MRFSYRFKQEIYVNSEIECFENISETMLNKVVQYFREKKKCSTKLLNPDLKI